MDNITMDDRKSFQPSSTVIHVQDSESKRGLPAINPTNPQFSPETPNQAEVANRNDSPPVRMSHPSQSTAISTGRSQSSFLDWHWDDQREEQDRETSTFKSFTLQHEADAYGGGEDEDEQQTQLESLRPQSYMDTKPVETKPLEQGQWICPTCTFINEGEKCAICNVQHEKMNDQSGASGVAGGMDQGVGRLIDEFDFKSMSKQNLFHPDADEHDEFDLEVYLRATCHWKQNDGAVYIAAAYPRQISAQIGDTSVIVESSNLERQPDLLLKLWDGVDCAQSWSKYQPDEKVLCIYLHKTKPEHWPYCIQETQEHTRVVLSYHEDELNGTFVEGDCDVDDDRNALDAGDETR